MRRIALIVFLLLLWAPAAYAWTWPVRGPVLVGYSFDRDHAYAGGQHRGIDIGSDAGTTVVAPVSGTVTFAGSVPTSGLSVTIATGDGHSVTLTHLGTSAVKKGASIGEGDAVGTVGPSGTPELDAPYLYMGVRVTSDPQGYLDPLSFLPAPAAPVAAPAHGTPTTTTLTTTTPAADASTVAAPAAPVAATAPEARVVASDDGIDPTAGDKASGSQERPAPGTSATAPAPPAAAPAAATADAPIAPGDPTPVPAPAFSAPALAEPVVAEPGGAALVLRSSALRRTPAAERPTLGRVLPVVARLSTPPAAPPRTGRHAPARAAALRSHAPIAPAAPRRPRPLPVVRAVPAHGSGFPLGLLVLGVLVATMVAAMGVRMISSSSQTSEGDLPDAVAEDPGSGRVAVRERAETSGPCGRPRSALRHLRPLSPAQRQRRPHGQRDGRARDAGDGVRRPRRRVAS